MNVKQLLSIIKYDANSPIKFNINNKEYYYYDLFNQENLLNVEINRIKVYGRVLELNEDDVIKVINKGDIKDKDIDLLLPNSSYYYLIIFKIN